MLRRIALAGVAGFLAACAATHGPSADGGVDPCEAILSTEECCARDECGWMISHDRCITRRRVCQPDRGCLSGECGDVRPYPSISPFGCGPGVGTESDWGICAE